ncbi:hypothetical protein P280DRAFT_521665 [Massarina eburnea CBS 473.64]|uniref:BTB domain-containing protein n=1 Tax=Massarina eburnea CBS 473.64 TaxID=1395130 RepID=A0A6A6RNK9_9PLEO|nr:hypothetical protein P280DRAFT_521665 [Massarina eburnea CBS 473.64]
MAPQPPTQDMPGAFPASPTEQENANQDTAQPTSKTNTREQRSQKTPHVDPSEPTGEKSMQAQKEQLAKIMEDESVKQAILHEFLTSFLDSRTAVGRKIKAKMPQITSAEECAKIVETEEVKNALREIIITHALDPHTQIAQDILRRHGGNVAAARRTRVRTHSLSHKTPSDLLAEINAKLDKMYLKESIVPAPTTSNPLLTDSGTVFLEATPTDSFSSSSKAPVYPPSFEVHKAILTHNTPRFAAYFYTHRKDRQKKCFPLDADKATLERFVAYLYHPKDYDLTRLPVDILVAFLCLSIDLHMAPLHNNVVEILVDRHTGFDHFLRYPRKFIPLRASVLRVYKKTRAGHGTRALCAYLLALSRISTINASEGDLEKQVMDDVHTWEDREKEAGAWVKMPASAFVLKSFASTSQAKLKEKGEEEPADPTQLNGREMGTWKII